VLPVTQYLTNHLWEFQPSYNFGAVWDKEKLIAHVDSKVKVTAKPYVGFCEEEPNEIK